MKRVFLSMLAISALVFTSCSDDNDNDVKPPVEAPATYAFTGKDGKSNVSFTGQEARLVMASELKSALGTNTKTEAQLIEMFKDGKGFAGTVPSNNKSVNESGKKLRGTVASATNSKVDAVETDELRLKMDGWIKDHATEVYANWNTDAAAGTAGKLTTGSRTVHVSAKGVEYNQAVAKTLIGSVIADQMINKYVSQKFIDDNKADHEAGKPYKGDDTKNYTALQHGWDEAYGYLFGLEEDPAKPVNSLDDRKGFLNSYIKSVDNDSKFKGIFDDVYNAFKLGRAAVDANDYELVSKQAETIRASVSKVIGVMAAHYLLKGKGAKDADSLHALSEAYGFLQSLRFVEINGQQVEKNQIAGTIAMLEADNGLWSITDDQLDQIASRLGTYFGFTTEDVVSLND
eukprot:TRINITY_DN593_c0_g1_i1.p1 TRINITY_DN593_c0_g1~~TRINITY_DN593_c0_g1_i1.p1  ORF type:complete len:402 (-),score=101.81 TRINITY_DN593_c0_g1_i1:43-1248(-)